MAVSAVSLAVAVVAMSHACLAILYQAQPGQIFNDNDDENSLRFLRLRRRVSALEDQVEDDLMPRINDLGAAVTLLARNQCQTGRVAVQPCPGFKEETQEQITICVFQPISGAEAFIQNLAVNFAQAYTNPPVVRLSFGGEATLIGQNVSLAVNSVSGSGFAFTYTADDLYPIASEITWYACPPAIFGPGQGLPLPS